MVLLTAALCIRPKPTKEELEVAVAQRSPCVGDRTEERGLLGVGTDCGSVHRLRSCALVVHCSVGHFPVGHFWARRLMISPAANSVSRSCSLSWDTACLSQVRFASRVLLRTAAPLAVNSMFSWRPSVGCGLRVPMPLSSRGAVVGSPYPVLSLSPR